MANLPQRPDTHTLADLGVLRASMIFHQWGWISDVIHSDYGEDLDCIIFTEKRRTNLQFRCQLKSFRADSYVRRLKSGNYSVSIKTSTAKSWIKCYYPILLIIYDVENDDIFWTNASKQIWANYKKLSQNTMTINIENSMNLDDSKSDVIYDVQKFYESILRISNPMLECTAYPILMPGYRSLSYFEMHDINKKININELKLDHDISSINHMPSWLTSILTLMPEQIYGLKIQKSTEEIDSFLKNVEEYLHKINYPIKEGEWLAFICSPVLLKSSDEGQMNVHINDIWIRELTGWWTYSVVNDKFISDFDYTFSPPKGLLRPVARHGRSWDNFYYLDMENDVAVEFYASIATTESYRRGISIHRQHFLSQFLPWVCPVHEINILNKILSSEELTFQIIDDLSNDEMEKIGVISTPFFNPAMGFYSMAKNWQEISPNNIVDILKKKDTFDKIPGRIGPEIVKKHVLSSIDYLDEPPESMIIRKPQYVTALPLIHDERVISLERYQYDPIINVDSTKKELKKCCEKVGAVLQKTDHVFYDLEEFSEYEGKSIYRIGINWKPDLKDSAVESYNKLNKIVIETFNKIMPSKKDNEDLLSNTYSIIHKIGVIHYSRDTLSDIPWGYAVAGDTIVPFSGKIEKTT